MDPFLPYDEARCLGNGCSDKLTCLRHIAKNPIHDRTWYLRNQKRPGFPLDKDHCDHYIEWLESKT